MIKKKRKKGKIHPIGRKVIESCSVERSSFDTKLKFKYGIRVSLTPISLIRMLLHVKKMGLGPSGSPFRLTSTWMTHLLSFFSFFPLTKSFKNWKVQISKIYKFRHKKINNRKKKTRQLSSKVATRVLLQWYHCLFNFL